MNARWSVLVVTSLLAAGCGGDSDPVVEEPPAGGPEQEIEIVRPIELTPEARIPQNDPGYERVEVFSNRLVFHYASDPAMPLEVGNVVAGGEEQGYLRRITAVGQVAGNTVEVLTAPAFIGDFILDGAFRIKHRPAPDKWQAASGDIFAQASALTEDSYSIFDRTVSEDKAVTCKIGGAASIKLDPTFDVDLDFDLDIDIEAGILPPHGELKHAIFAVSGEIEAGAEATISGQLSANCVADFIKELREKKNNRDLLKLQIKPIQFMAGPIPIVITHHLEPILKNTLQAKVSIAGVTLGGKAKLGLRAGTEYKDGEWHEIWEPKADGEVWVQLSDDSGEFELSNTFTVGVQYMAFLWDAAGPKLGVTINGDEKLTANLQSCKWKAGIYFGVDVIYGAQTQIPVIHKTLWDYAGKMNLVKEPILEEQGDIPSCGEDAGNDAGLDASPDADAGTDSTTPPPPEIVVTKKWCDAVDNFLYEPTQTDVRVYACYWRLENKDGSKGYGCGSTLWPYHGDMISTDGQTVPGLFEIHVNKGGATAQCFMDSGGSPKCPEAGPPVDDYWFTMGCSNSTDMWIKVGLLEGESATLSIAAANAYYYTYNGGGDPLTVSY